MEAPSAWRLRISSFRCAAISGKKVRRRDAFRIALLAREADLEEDLARPLRHRLLVPELVVLDEIVQQPLDARDLQFLTRRDRRPDRPFAPGRFRVDLLDAMIGERLEEIVRLERVGLLRLLDLAQQPMPVHEVERPELLERRRLLVAAQETVRPVVNVVVLRAGADQRGELAAVGVVRVAHVHQVHRPDVQALDDVDLVVADHALDLPKVLGVEVGHQQRLHRRVIARLPALLELHEHGARRAPPGGPARTSGSLFAMNSSSFRVLSALFAIAERLYEKSRFSPRSFSFSLMTGSKMKTAMKPNQIRRTCCPGNRRLPWNPPPPPKPPPPPPLLWTTNPSAMNVCGSPTRRLNTGHASPVERHSMTEADSTRPVAENADPVAGLQLAGRPESAVGHHQRMLGGGLQLARRRARRP